VLEAPYKAGKARSTLAFSVDLRQSYLGFGQMVSATKEEGMKILLAVDGSEYTKRMLAYLAAHQELLGPRHDYTVIHCTYAVPPHPASYVGAATVQQFYDEEAEAVFKPVRAFLHLQSIEATYVQRAGQAAQAIASVAQDGNFDLLVMGSRGNGNLANLALGSVSTKVLALCTTPVLLVR
jgi:nucleotide-binding universal stress UspA family protein